MLAPCNCRHSYNPSSVTQEGNLTVEAGVLGLKLYNHI